MVENHIGLGKNMEKCTGCSACSNKCPVTAIVMKENKEGFCMPKVLEEKCINCGVCTEACPIITQKHNNNKVIKIYSAMAFDDVIRMESSSGGVFSVLANYVIKSGGVVCGAAYTENYMGVEHILIEAEEDLYKLRGSKYVQSSTGYIFREIKCHLQNGRKVLYSGTPCQVAGLKSYLDKEYENLICLDLICHGVPSPLAYRKYVKSVLMNVGMTDRKIVEVSFRKKQEWGWAPSVYIKLDNDYVYSKSRNQTSWYNSFLNGLNCRLSCGDCHFNKIPRIGDLTLGDFWGVGSRNDIENDGKGISIISVNNNKGKRILSEIKGMLKHVIEIDLKTAQIKNWNLVGSSSKHKNRKRFFELLLQKDDYNKVVNYSLNRKFDIGFVGWWYGQNYGSVLTNFALNRYLKSLNYSILMIEWPEHTKNSNLIPDSFARRFAKKYYEISMRRTYDELPDLNKYCDMFVVGSDQLWNYWSTKDNGCFFFLDFVDDSKKKIAYATSFGHSQYGAPQDILEQAAFHLQRFDNISVREKDGIEICRETFGVDAVCTMDPVFLCDKTEYRKLVKMSRVREDGPYIFAYILSPSLEKKSMIERISAETGFKVVLILDAQKNIEKNRIIMDMPNALRDNLEIEDWLYYIANSEMVLTDSYHGLCFSIIFQKKFFCIGNISRGLSRFQTLLHITGLEDHMSFKPEDAVSSRKYLDEIDYASVWGKLEKEVIRSKSWLITALESPKECKASGYDLLLRRIRTLEKQIEKLEVDKKSR